MANAARVSLAKHNRLNQATQIITRLHEVIGQAIEQLRVAGWIVRMHLIERMDQATTEESCPNSIGNVASKVAFYRFHSRPSRPVSRVGERLVAAERPLYRPVPIS